MKHYVWHTNSARGGGRDGSQKQQLYHTKVASKPVSLPLFPWLSPAQRHYSSPSYCGTDPESMSHCTHKTKPNLPPSSSWRWNSVSWAWSHLAWVQAEVWMSLPIILAVFEVISCVCVVFHEWVSMLSVQKVDGFSGKLRLCLWKSWADNY